MLHLNLEEFEQNIPSESCSEYSHNSRWSQRRQDIGEGGDGIPSSPCTSEIKCSQGFEQIKVSIETSVFKQGQIQKPALMPTDEEEAPVVAKENWMEANLLRTLSIVSSLQVLRSIWLGKLTVWWLLAVGANCSFESIKGLKDSKVTVCLEWLKTYDSQPLVSLQVLLSLAMLRSSILCEVNLSIDALTAAALVAVHTVIRT